MSTLFDIKNDILILAEMLGDENIDQEVLDTTLEGVKEEFFLKADDYARVRLQIKANIAAIKEEENRLANRRRSMENNLKRLENTLQSAMEETGETKFKTNFYTFNIQNNPASVVIDDVTKVPQNFLIPQEPKIDKTLVKDLLKETEVPWAHLEQSRGLRIK